MSNTNGTTQQAQPSAPAQRPIDKWVARHMANGGDSDDIMASARLFEELICAHAIAETVAPGMFSFDDKLTIRDNISEARITLESVDPGELAEHARVVDAAQDSPIGQWLMANDASSRHTDKPIIRHLLALNAAAAREVLADMRCAQAVGRSVPGGEKLTTAEALRVYEALCEHKERLAAQQEAQEAQEQKGQSV